MFEKFTKKAQMAIDNAEKVAKEFGHLYIASEHILYGLSKVKDSIAAKALLNQELDSKKIYEKIEFFVGKEDDLNHSKNIEYTPRVKRIFEDALHEAVRLGAGYVGTEHLLIALMKERDSVAVKVLVSYKINIPRIYDEILNVVSTNREINTSYEKKDSNTPTLDKFSRDFTELAKMQKFDPIIGRKEEIERVIQILSRRTKNNPVLIGEPGVGKTAIIEGLAQKIVEGNIPELLKGKRVVSLDLSSMVAGAKYRGEFEGRIKKAIEEVINARDVILFIDELHTIVGAGAADGAIDASNILKPSLARGEVQVVGATTIDEYRKHIEKDAALERRFQSILVEEPTEAQALKILDGLREKYETHHSVKITDEAIKASVKLSNRFITDRFLPDKAIDLIDEAASKVRLKIFTAPPEVKDIEKELEKLEVDKEEAIKSEEYEKAGIIKKKQTDLKAKLDNALLNWNDSNQGISQTVDEEEIAEVISTWTGIPVKKIEEEESKKLKDLEKILMEKIIGQDDAIKSLSKAIRRGRVGLKDPKRPIGSFLFLGPTGVGKTELTKVLSETLFGTKESLIRVDMSEYMEKHNVSKLIGSPPGYVGYEEGGQLSEQIRRKPYSVVLFDEIEKAHPDVFNILLQVLDDGHITDAQGRKIDFKNTVIIMTSNMGAKEIVANKKLGFKSEENSETDYEAIKDKILKIVKDRLKPEFINRIDDLVVFRRLSKDNTKEISRILINELRERIKENMLLDVEVDESVLEFIVEKSYDENYGARPLKRAIQDNIENILAEKVLEGKIKDKRVLHITNIDEKIEVEIKE
ncbi:MAG: ATP-dependent Clp protease ATP-binding subunit [Clostridia bacterium]|jgi:ATP-dependent Clp protease ATP-binding subunit ClpC|nr:ATP-dependent Clp protease ATP-binding subunit [Clostridia bacterium]